MKRFYSIVLAALLLVPATSMAQENKKEIHKDTIATTPPFDTTVQTNMESSVIAPVTDFTPGPLMVKMMQINPVAINVPPMAVPYLAKWDEGSILGFSGSRGTYLGPYQGIDIQQGNWGLMLGVQQGYLPYSGQFRVMPIAMPYYNLHGVKLGVDVGGAIFNAQGAPKAGNPLGIKNYHGSGIIAPPIDTRVRFGTAEIPQWMEKQFDQQESNIK